MFSHPGGTVWVGLAQKGVSGIPLEWLNLFQGVGLELVEEEVRPCRIDTINIAETYKHLERHDLECKALIVIHQKPC